LNGVRTDAKHVSTVHVLVERELSGHFLCGGDDARIYGRGDASPDAD